MIIAYDSARPRLIPKTAGAIFPYADGHYRWDRSEFPTALYRYITVTASHWQIDIADVEPGCVWPPENLTWWATQRHQRDLDITVYCDRSNYAAIEALMRKLGFEWHLFLSTLDGTVLTEWEGKPVRACQFTDRSGAYDMSEVFDEGWLNKP